MKAIAKFLIWSAGIAILMAIQLFLIGFVAHIICKVFKMGWNLI